MVATCRIFNGVKFFRSKIIYTSKKEVETEAKEWEKDGFDTRVLRSTEKIKNKYQYRIYTRDKRGYSRSFAIEV